MAPSHAPTDMEFERIASLKRRWPGAYRRGRRRCIELEPIAQVCQPQSGPGGAGRMYRSHGVAGVREDAEPHIAGPRGMARERLGRIDRRCGQPQLAARRAGHPGSRSSEGRRMRRVMHRCRPIAWPGGPSRRPFGRWQIGGGGLVRGETGIEQYELWGNVGRLADCEGERHRQKTLAGGHDLDKRHLDAGRGGDGFKTCRRSRGRRRVRDLQCQRAALQVLKRQDGALADGVEPRRQVPRR